MSLASVECAIIAAHTPCGDGTWSSVPRSPCVPGGTVCTWSLPWKWRQLESSDKYGVFCEEVSSASAHSVLPPACLSDMRDVIAPVPPSISVT